MAEQPFWLTRKLTEMSECEWESLCDGCGLCCLEKFEDKGSGELVFSTMPCSQLDVQSCRCKVYDNRHAVVPDCVPIDPGKMQEYRWLPDSCGYRRVFEGRDLPDWHPLKTGCPDSTRAAGMGVNQITTPAGRNQLRRRLRGKIKPGG